MNTTTTTTPGADDAAPGELRYLALAEIQVVPGHNPRAELLPEALAELVTSVRNDGVLVPLLVRPAGEDGRYPLTAGHRRLEAARLAGLERVPALIRAVERSATRSALVENVAREALSPIEEAQALKRMRREERLSTHKALAASIGKPAGWVSERLRLLKLPAGAQGYVHRGRVPLGLVALLLKVAKVSPPVADALALLVASGQVSPELLTSRPEHVVGELDRYAGVPAEAYAVPARAHLAPDALLAREEFTELFERWDAAAPENAYRQRPHFGYFTLSDEVEDQARAYGCLLDFGEDEGNPYFGGARAFVTDRAFVLDRVGEQLGAMEEQHAERERERVAAENAAQRSHAEAAGLEVDEASAEELERAAERQRQAEREAEKQDRGEARGANLELGRRLLEGLQAPELTMDVARLLALLVLNRDAGQLAARGLRYVREELQEVEVRELKSGQRRERITYADPSEAEAHLWAWLERAQTAHEVIGRLLQPLIAAQCADQSADQSVLARSNQVFFSVPGAHGHGREREIPELLAKLALPMLPPRLAAQAREEAMRRAERSAVQGSDYASRAEREAVKQDAEESDVVAHVGGAPIAREWVVAEGAALTEAAMEAYEASELARGEEGAVEWCVQPEPPAQAECGAGSADEAAAPAA